MTKARDLSKSSGTELPLAGGAMTGAITTNSTIDGRDVAADGVTADAALPKAGGTMTGVIAGFESTGIDDNATSTAITIDASENVGIGTSSVDSLLHLQKSDATAYSATATDGQVGVGPTLYLENPANSNATVGGQIVFGMRSTESQARIGATGGANPELTFGTNDSERMRIDSSGNVLVGKTSPTISTAGVELRPSGQLFATQSGNYPLLLNRTTNDGAIAEFRKDGTTVGSIGTGGNELIIGTGNTALRFWGAGNALLPRTTANGVSNGVITLGEGSNRFKDAYLSGGVYLGGTDSPHKLDDYEEGTWTPRFRRTSGTWVNSTKTGTWQRIGNTVHIEAEVILASNLTGTGAYVRIGGLPFAVGSGGGNGMCVLRYASQSTVPSMKWDISTEGYIFVQGSGSGGDAYNYIDSGTQTGLFGMYTV